LETSQAIHMKHKRLAEDKHLAVKKAKNALQTQLRRAQKEHHDAGVAARRTNREQRKKLHDWHTRLRSQGIPIPEYPPNDLLPVRDPEKQPTELELHTLLPNPSLQQALAEAEELATELPIDPQIMAENNIPQPILVGSGSSVVDSASGVDGGADAMDTAWAYDSDNASGHSAFSGQIDCVKFY
jgi:hypothetical protein